MLDPQPSSGQPPGLVFEDGGLDPPSATREGSEGLHDHEDLNDSAEREETPNVKCFIL